MRPAYEISSLDLRSLARVYQAREATPSDIIELVLERIAAYSDRAVWTYLVPKDELLERASRLERQWAAGERLPLFGVPFGIKDSIDLAGHPTTAACPAYSYIPKHSSPVVQRLIDAGAIPIGKNNLDQFGTGLAGDRSPYGACRNVFRPEYISGGSSSGSAVAVAAGLVSFALGTDTAGSGRVPAGANNVVGFKQSHGRLSTQGVVPSCASLDCVAFLALTAHDAEVLFSLAAGEAPPPSDSEIGPFSFAVAAAEELEFCGDAERSDLFRQSLARLEAAGCRRQTIAFGPFRETAQLLYEGPWVAERLSAMQTFFSDHPRDVYPVTRAIIEQGARYSAVDVFRAQHRLAELKETCLPVFEHADVLVLPTFPTLPTLAEVQADSLGWSRRLGTYTNFANLLGLCAIAVPAGFTESGLPFGITLLARAGRERRLCEIGAWWQRQLDLPLGATQARLPPIERVAVKKTNEAAEGWVRVSVAGAHLRNQPLHPALRQFGARFVRTCRTAAKYRFFAFLELDPPRPGLLQTEAGGGAVTVEVYDLPYEGFGRLVASVAPPLAIGTVELEDGAKVKGFLCESSAAATAPDITEFGGWVAFREQTLRPRTRAELKPA
jgi:allophanate hydrolase